VIYNPHNIKQIELLTQEVLDSPSEEALFSKKVVLFLGRLSLQKAPWHLIKAFSLLQNDEDSIQLVFIGDGDQHMTDYLDQLIEKLQITKNVVFLGRKSNPYKYLKKATVLALSSYYEGTPNVIVEAIATETPIVSSNCTGGIVELMSVNQKKKCKIISKQKAASLHLIFLKVVCFFLQMMILPKKSLYLLQRYML